MAVVRTFVRRVLSACSLAVLLSGLVVRQGEAATGGGAPRWQPIGLSGVSVHALTVSARGAGPTFAGTQSGIYRYIGGHAWKRVLSSDSVGDVVLLSDDKTVLACDNSGFVDVSVDAGRHWQRHAVTPLGVFSVSSQPGNAKHLLAAATGGIYLSQDAGKHWQRRYSIKEGAAGSLVWAPGSSKVVFAGSAVGGSASRSVGVIYSRDGGFSWRPFGNHPDDGGAIMSLTVTPHDVYIGTMGNAVWRASMSLKNWHRVAGGMPAINDHGAGLATIPAHPDTIYVGTVGFGVYRTSDGGAHWKSLSAGLSADTGATVVRSIVYSVPQHAMYAGTDGGVYLLAGAK